MSEISQKKKMNMNTFSILQNINQMNDEKSMVKSSELFREFHNFR